MSKQAKIFRAVNPKNNKFICEFPTIEDKEIDLKMDKAFEAYNWKQQRGLAAVEGRHKKFASLMKILDQNKFRYADLIVDEMGKPRQQAVGEIEKSIAHIDYYDKNMENFMAEENLKLLNGGTARIMHQPLGPTLVILPWNFPFWMAFKSALPPLAIGNPILLKHAPSTPQCALAIEEAFQEAGFNQGDFQNLFASVEQTGAIIGDRRTRAVKFTGSTEGGYKVAALCGQHMRKSALELGGNDPFLALRDCNIDKAVDAAYRSRMGANGQACINAKRFIIQDEIYDEFKEKLIQRVKKTVIGDPMDPQTTLGPLASQQQVDLLKSQVRLAQQQGGNIIYGDLDYEMKDPNLKDGAWFAPIITEGIDFYQSSYEEEFFGPVFNLYRVASSKELLDYANKSNFGLGATIFTENMEKAENFAVRLRTGSVCINDVLSSYSDMPSGGIKNSGFGRECFTDGLHEISNQKSILNPNWD